MARLELGPDEASTLREALEIYLRDFRREVAGTENPKFRHALQQRQAGRRTCRAPAGQRRRRGREQSRRPRVTAR